MPRRLFLAALLWPGAVAAAQPALLATQPVMAQPVVPELVITFPEPVRIMPEPVRAMIEAAIATGDRNKVAAVVEAARATHPDNLDEIDRLHTGFLEHQRELATAKALADELALREAGLFGRWKGRGEVGGYQATGNTSNIGFTAALSMERIGIDWQHQLCARADYQRNNGRTARERYLAAYEPRVNFSTDLFVYGLAQFESDRFQGFDTRLSTSGGLGYQLFDTDSLDLSLKAGPAFRQTHFSSGTTESSVGALAGFDFDWRIFPDLTLTQDANLVAAAGGSAVAFVDNRSSTLYLVTGLEAKITDGLTTRLSYTVDHNSNPPAGAVATDTQTRFSLIYGF